MIKIEINNEVTRIDMAGPGAYVHLEMGVILRRYHEGLCEDLGKEAADELILALAKNTIMTEEEKKKETDRIKRKDPATFHTAVVLERMRQIGSSVAAGIEMALRDMELRKEQKDEDQRRDNS